MANKKPVTPLPKAQHRPVKQPSLERNKPVTCYQFSSHYKAIPGIIHDHPFLEKVGPYHRMVFWGMVPAFDTADEAIDWASSHKAEDEITYHLLMMATKLHQVILSNVSDYNDDHDYFPEFEKGHHHTFYTRK